MKLVAERLAAIMFRSLGVARLEAPRLEPRDAWRWTLFPEDVATVVVSL